MPAPELNSNLAIARQGKDFLDAAIALNALLRRQAQESATAAYGFGIAFTDNRDEAKAFLLVKDSETVRSPSTELNWQVQSARSNSLTIADEALCHLNHGWEGAVHRQDSFDRIPDIALQVCRDLAHLPSFRSRMIVFDLMSEELSMGKHYQEINRPEIISWAESRGLAAPS